MEQSAAKQQSTKPEQESTTAAAAAPVNYMAYAQQYAQYAQQYRTTDPATADYYLQCYNYYVALAQTTSDPSIPAPAFPGAQIDPYSMGAVSMDQANMGYDGDEAMQKYTVAGSSKKKSDQSTEKLDEILRLHKKPQDGPGGKVKTVVRAAGGEVWHDPTLAEWDPNDFRLFVGDLGKDVSDDMLSSAFRKYPSFIRAKVVRDKRTSKTKGYATHNLFSVMYIFTSFL